MAPRGVARGMLSRVRARALQALGLAGAHGASAPSPIPGQPLAAPPARPPYRETPEERVLRSAAFLKDPIPWWISPAGYAIFAALAVGIIPLIYPPGVRRRVGTGCAGECAMRCGLGGGTSAARAHTKS